MGVALRLQKLGYLLRFLRTQITMCNSIMRVGLLRIRITIRCHPVAIFGLPVRKKVDRARSKLVAVMVRQTTPQMAVEQLAVRNAEGNRRLKRLRIAEVMQKQPDSIGPLYDAASALGLVPKDPAGGVVEAKASIVPKSQVQLRREEKAAELKVKRAEVKRTRIPGKYGTLRSLSVPMLVDRMLKLYKNFTKELVHRHVVIASNPDQSKTDCLKFLTAATGIDEDFQLSGESRFYEGLDEVLFVEHQARQFRLADLTLPMSWPVDGILRSVPSAEGIILCSGTGERIGLVPVEHLPRLPLDDFVLDKNHSEIAVRLVSASGMARWKGLLLRTFVSQNAPCPYMFGDGEPIAMPLELPQKHSRDGFVKEKKDMDIRVSVGRMQAAAAASAAMALAEQVLVEYDERGDVAPPAEKRRITETAPAQANAPTWSDALAVPPPPPAPRAPESAAATASGEAGAADVGKEQQHGQQEHAGLTEEG